MVFQLRPQDGRNYQYPDAQDSDFLGYDRPSDRWKVDASGIHLYASGISVELDKSTDSVAVWSASGTRTIPTYIDGGSVDVDLDQSTDSIRVYSASGTRDLGVYMTSPVEVVATIGDSIEIYSASGSAEIETWINNQPIQTTVAEPLDGTLVKKRLEYNGNNDLATLKEASVVTPSGSPCKLSTFSYNGNNDIDYIIESLGTW